ncbi:cysteine-rich protein 2-binding protein [Chrysoperla carnea]|uniref:cysteine-rich protein 2-binding protein n=1 Tax=Chrysoperla carnea TaxID=189513 RepID=UPI001D082A0E|nr:cysteine-rich protein 2-binding protein [Chrysoperla carnea]
MQKCEKCNQLVHILCLKRKSTPGGIIGDVFFDFTCTECNNGGEEIFNRSKMPWFQAITLVLYDIMHKSEGTGRYGFFHWKVHINSYIERHWHVLFRKDFKRKKNWIGTVSGTLSIYSPLFFTSGTEILGEGGWWKLTYPNLCPEIIVQLCSDLTQIKHQNKELKHTLNIQKDLEIINKILLEKYNFVQPVIDATGNDLCNEAPPKRLKYEEEISTDDNSSNQENNEIFNIPLIPTLDDDNFNLNIDDDDYNLGFDSFDFSSQSIFSDLFEDSKKSQETEDNQSLEYHELEDNKNTTPSEPVNLSSLFNPSNSITRPWENIECPNYSPKDSIAPLTTYEENELFNKLNRQEFLSPHLRRILCKLRLRKQKRERNIKVFNIDKIYDELSKNPNRPIEMNKNEITDQYLDRYHNAIMLTKSKTNQENIPFHLKLIGYNEPKPFLSPYTNRILKPYIRRDFEIHTSDRKPVWLALMDELKIKVKNKHPSLETECGSNAPIDYCYVRSEHIPAINLLCELYFWPGIDMSESLRYPDFSCVVLYKKIIIGFAFMIPDVAYNESYISFIFTRPEWRRTGIATFMLYHLVQTCMGKEVTLHVSATNPAVILYQKFGFKVEEFIQDFYEKYMVDNNRECKHALFLRLGR